MLAFVIFSFWHFWFYFSTKKVTKHFYGINTISHIIKNQNEKKDILNGGRGASNPLPLCEFGPNWAVIFLKTVLQSSQKIKKIIFSSSELISVILTKKRPLKPCYYTRSRVTDFEGSVWILCFLCIIGTKESSSHLP